MAIENIPFSSETNLKPNFIYSFKIMSVSDLIILLGKYLFAKIL